MGVSTNTESRSRGAYQIIQGHTALLAKIVNADGPVRRKQYDGKMGKLQHEGIIERVDRVVDDSGDNTHRYYRWRIASRYREMVEAVVDSQAHLPCAKGTYRLALCRSRQGIRLHGVRREIRTSGYRAIGGQTMSDKPIGTWTPIGATYIKRRQVWTILHARYTPDGWQYRQRVEDVEEMHLHSDREGMHDE